MENLEKPIGINGFMDVIFHLLNPLFVLPDKKVNMDTNKIDCDIDIQMQMQQVPRCVALIGKEHTGTTFMMKHIAEKLGTELAILDEEMVTSYNVRENITNAFKKSNSSENKKLLIYISRFDNIGGILHKNEAKNTLVELIRKYAHNVVTFIKTDVVDSFPEGCEVNLTIPHLSYKDSLYLLVKNFKSIKLNEDIDYSLVLKPMRKVYPDDIIGLCRKVTIQAKLKMFENKDKLNNTVTPAHNKLQICADDFEKVLRRPCKKKLKNNKNNKNTCEETDNINKSYGEDNTEIPYNIIGLDSLRDDITRYCEIIFDNNKPNTKLKQSLLVYGPDGIGKKKLILYIQKKLNIPIYTISGKDFSSYSNNDKTMETIFEKTRPEPCIVFVRDLHLAGNVKNTLSDFNTLVNKLDPHRLILFTSNKSYEYRDIFPIQFSAKGPNDKERLKILQMYDFTEDGVTNAKDIEAIDLDEVSIMTDGYVGNELNILCGITMMQSILDGKPVTTNALKDTLQIFEKKEINIESPNILFSDISGLEEAKNIIEDIIIYPSLYPSVCKEYDIPTSSGVILYGEPGCGKTLLAKAIATECKSSFISVRGPELLSSYFGETEKQIRNLFEKAKQNSPCVIFFDEIDAIGKERGGKNAEISDRILTQLLTELDGMGGRDYINVIAATNRKDQLDPALLRSGRFDKHVYIGAPNHDAIKSIIIHSMKKVNCKDINYDEIIGQINKYSGADVVNLCNTAKQIAFREKIQNKLDSNPVTQQHFMEGLEVINKKSQTK